MGGWDAALTSCNIKLRELQDQECYEQAERGAIQHKVFDGDPSGPEPDQEDLAEWVYALFWPRVYVILCL